MQQTKKNRMKKILKQDINSRQRKDIVPVSNLKARKITLCCRCQSTWLIIDSLLLLSLRCCSVVALLSLCCCSAGTLLPLLLLRCRCCRSCYCYAVTAAIVPAVTTLSLLLLLWCRSGVALVSLCYRSVISLLSLRCCSAAADITAAVASAVAPAVTPLLSL